MPPSLIFHAGCLLIGDMKTAIRKHSFQSSCTPPSRLCHQDAERRHGPREKTNRQRFAASLVQVGCWACLCSIAPAVPADWVHCDISLRGLQSQRFLTLLKLSVFRSRSWRTPNLLKGPWRPNKSQLNFVKPSTVQSFFKPCNL